MSEPNVEAVGYVPKWLKILGNIIKWTFITICAAVISWLVLRAVWQKGPKSIRRYYMTEASYRELEDGKLTVKRLSEFNSNELGKLFYISDVFYTEETSQLQFTLRYNIYGERAGGLLPDKMSFYLIGDDRRFDGVTADYKKTAMYYHYKVVIENIDFDGVENFDVIISHNGEDIDSCRAYINGTAEENHKLSAKEKKLHEGGK